MVVNKRKKNSRQRGSKTHGFGIGSKHNKGAGNRGGRGNAGSGKRADTKKPSFWKERYFGKYGFVMRGVKRNIHPMNLLELEEHLEDFLSRKLITKENDVYVVDLSKLGYNKLLGNGHLKNKFKITARYASAGAIEKVKNAGGEVILLSEKQK